MNRLIGSVLCLCEACQRCHHVHAVNEPEPAKQSDVVVYYMAAATTTAGPTPGFATQSITGRTGEGTRGGF